MVQDRTIDNYDSTKHRWGVGPGRLVIIGPPGTGKTRIALDDFAMPAISDRCNVLCCSFSRAAAEEMRSRSAETIGADPRSLREMFSTIHSEALRRISVDMTWSLYNGVSRSARPLKGGSVAETADVVSYSGLRQTTIAFWDYARAVMVEDKGDLLDIAGSFARRSYSEIDIGPGDIIADRDRYEAEKAKGVNYIDFTDMLTKTLGVDPLPLDLLLVDEAQDCSALQWAVIDHWAKAAKAVVIIGDPDQAINEFAGAVPKLLTDRIVQWPTTKLHRSWRVPASVHAVARSVILKNRGRIDAEYLPAERDGSVHNSGSENIVAVIDKCQRNDVRVFVLSRWIKGLDWAVNELRSNGIPFVNERGGSPWGRRQYCQALSALLRINNGEQVRALSLRLLCKAIPAKSGAFLGKKGETIDSIVGAADDLVDASRVLDVSKLGDPRALGFDDDSVEMIHRAYGISALENDPVTTLTTFHASKGREAEVAIVSMDAPIPVSTAIDMGDIVAIEEERRLLYVSYTRASECLITFSTGNGDLHKIA